MRNRKKTLAFAGLILAVFSYAWAAILIRWASDAQPLAIAFWRVAITAIVWQVFAGVNRVRGKSNTITDRQRKLIILAGLFLCFHFATWISSLSYTTIASASFLILVQPLLIAVAAHLFLHEKLNRWNILGMILTVVGAGLICGGDLSLDRQHLFGDGLALLGAIGSTAYLFVARLARPDKPGGEKGIALIDYLPNVYLVSAFGLLVINLVGGIPLVGYSSKTWLFLIVLAFIPTVIGHSLFNWAMRYLPAFTVNILVVGEPIGASILAYLLLSEIPSQGLIFGSLLMLVAVILIVVFPPKEVQVVKTELSQET